MHAVRERSFERLSMSGTRNAMSSHKGGTHLRVMTMDPSV